MNNEKWSVKTSRSVVYRLTLLDAILLLELADDLVGHVGAPLVVAY